IRQYDMDRRTLTSSVKSKRGAPFAPSMSERILYLSRQRRQISLQRSPTMTASSRKWIWITAAFVILVVAGGAGTFIWLLVLSQREHIAVKERTFPNGITGSTLLIDGVDHGLSLAKPDDPQDQGNPDKDFSRLPSSYYHRQ